MMQHVVSVRNRVEDIISGSLSCLKMPWTALSGLTNAILPGTITLLCGDPGASKSFMLMQMLLWWYESGYPICTFELEGDIEFYLMRAIAQKTGTPGITNHDWIKEHSDEARSLLIQSAEFAGEFGHNIHTVKAVPPTLDHLALWVQQRAEEGHRVICVDPMTMATYVTRKSWEEDAKFLSEVGHIASDYKCSIILLTHPTKAMGKVGPDMSLLSGSAAYSRFVDTIIWLEAHDEKISKVKTMMGSIEITHNRTLHILKARHGIGRGFRIAMTFQSDTLTLRENGTIIRKPKKDKDE